MRNRLAVVLAAAAAIVTASGMVLSAQGGGARAAIEALNAKWSVAVKAGKAADVAAMYTEDAVVFPPNAEAARGRAAIQKVWQGTFDAGVKEIALTTTNVEESAGGVALEEGTAVVKDGTGKVLDKAKYLVVWKQVGGTWMIHRDIWNSTMPAPAPEKKMGSG